MSDLAIPKNLVEQLCKGNCVLFVGAGISMGEGGLPGGGQLAKELAERCGYPSEDLALDRVAQYYAASKRSKADMLKYVCQRIRKARREPMETHQLIAALPFKVIVSTNYDCLLERALEEAGKLFNVIITDKQVSSWEEGVVNLLKIHGCVSQWESIVITKDDYREFFERRPNIANILGAEAARRSLLFIGHGLKDDDLDRIYSQVTRTLAEFCLDSYAVQLHPDPVDITLWKDKGLEIIDADATKFLTALKQAVAVAMPVELAREEVLLPERPYKFLDYFEAQDRAIFYGRELEAPALQRKIMAHKLTVLYGASGVGKTSLLQAGVMPRLHEDGYSSFYVRSLEDPAQAIKAEALRLARTPKTSLDEEARTTALHSYLRQVLPPETRLVIFLDQFEEFFIRLGDKVRRAFIEELATCLEDDALEMRAVLSLRDDYFQRLDEFDERWPEVFENRFRLRNLDEDRARLAIFLPARQFGLSYEDELLRQLLADLESGGVEPAQLQIVCYRLYEDLVTSGHPGTFTLARYQALGGTKAILAGYLDDVLEKLPEGERELARGVLKSMVIKKKAALSAREIAQDKIVRRLGLDEDTVGRILATLRDSRVVRKLTLAEGESYELAHEVMVEKVWQWVTEKAVAVPVEEAKEEVPLPEHPYKFLDYFEAADQAIFYGRELEVPALQRQIITHKMTVLYGASGVGKTSLIQAEVIPRLREDGYTIFYVRSLEDPVQAIKAEALRLVWGPEAQLDEEASVTALHLFLRRVLPSEIWLVVFLDQFEELFIRLGKGVRRAFIEELAACLEDDALEMRAVLSLRDDYFVHLDEFSERWPGVFDSRFRLRNLDEDKARLAIFRPAQQFGLSYEDELLRQLLADLESDGVEPAQLQIVCYRLYEDLVTSGHPGTFTLARYQALGETKAILAGYLDDVLEKLPEEERELARGVLKSMVTGEETKAALSVREIAQDEIVRWLGLDEDTVGRILAELWDSRVVRKLTLAEGESYELAHEVMVEKVWQWVTEEEARFKYVRDMLRQDLNNYRNLGLLMPLDRLEIVNFYREEMSLSEEELELLFRSALKEGYEVAYWRHRADQAGLLEQLADEWLRKLEDEATATEAIVTLGGIGTPRLVERLVPMVEADFTWGVVHDVLHLATARQRRAVAALSKMTCHEAIAALARWTPQDMALIPAGPFVMGSTEYGDEGPVHQVWLDAFWMACHPVTNAEYAEFIRAGGYREREYWTEAGWEWKQGRGRTQPDNWDERKHKRDRPVREITWYEAVAYARWRGATLPSEAQWEKAARGGLEIPNLKSQIPNELVSNPNPERRYPWGDEFDKNKCNTSESGIGDTTPLGRYSPQGDSPYGVADMAGNVEEWTSSLFSPYPYKAEDGREDLEAKGGRRVLRGGSFDSNEYFARCSYRHSIVPDYGWSHFGCRVGWCAAPALPLDSGF